MPNTSGSFPGTTRGNTYDYCVFRVTATSPSPRSTCRTRSTADTYQYCTIIGGDRGIKDVSTVNNLTVDHCTVVGVQAGRGASLRLEDGARLDGEQHDRRTTSSSSCRRCAGAGHERRDLR